MKKITLLLFALLSSWQISAQVGILQNFDSGTTLPTGWTETGSKTIAAAESCSGNSIRDNLYASSATGTLVSPNQVAASNATDLTVSFDYKIEDWNTPNPRAAGWGNIQVQYSTNNGGAWTTFFTINDGNHIVANTCATFSNVIPAASLPNGSDVRIRFLFTWVAGDYDIYIDNFSALQTTVLPPLCTTISSPANGATNVLSSIISWNSANGIPTGYKLNVGTSPGGTNILNMFDVGNVTTYNLGTLISGATHYVTVIPYNANGDATGCTESSFTACGAISALPHTEPFATFLPNCWQEGDNGDLTVGPAIFGSGSWLVDGLGNVGTTGAIRVTLDGATDNDWVLSPEFFIPAGGYELKFTAAATQGGLTTAPTTAWESDDFVEVLASTTGFNNWATIFTYNDVNVPSNVGTINAIDLSAYSGQTVRFAFRAVEGASNGAASVDFSVDDFSVRLTPTCPDQTGLTVNNVTSSSANTSWDDLSGSGAIGYQYAITTSATPPASGTGTLATFYAASGLLPQTVYYLHVRSECAASTFGNWATTSFTTGCAPLVTLPWIENFDALTPGTNVFPTCWAYSNTTSTWSISTTPVAYSGANSLRRTWSTDGWAFTPTATLTAGTSYRFSYYVRTNDAVVGYDITVGVGNSQTSAAMTTTLSTVAGYQGPAWVRVNHEFTPTVTGEYSFGVHVVAPLAPNGINFDDFKIELSPTCPDQTGLTIGTVTSSTADTSWDDLSGSGAVGYEYAITTSATPPASGTSTTATIYAATGLSPLTVYYLHVRAECSGSTYGVWATTTFTTACAPVSVPVLEPFNTFLPNVCWTEADNGDLTAGPLTFGSGSWLVDGFGNVGTTGAARVTLDAATDNDWIISPEFIIPATGYELKFDAAATQGGTVNTPTTPWESDDFVEILVSTTNTTNWTPLYTYNDTNSPSNLGSANILDLDAYSGQTVRFAFRAVEGVTNGAASIDFSIDNFEIRLTPPCPDQTGLTIGTVTATTADFSWDDLNLSGALGYEYAITTSATPPASGTSTTATIYSATSLSPQTVYYMHVRASCAASTFGNWATVTFTTACAPLATLPWLENFDALTPGTNVFPSCWNYSNALSTWSISTTPVAYSGANSLRRTWSTDGWAFTPMFSLTAGTSYTYSYFVRTNDAVVGYDITVGVGNSQNSAAMTTTLSSVVGYQGPAWTLVSLEYTPTVSGDYSFGVHVVAPFAPNGINFDDFELKLTPACPAPIASTSNITSLSADLSWAAVPSATLGYEYVLDNVATDPAGAGTSTTALTYSATGLTQLTTYYFHIRSVCSVGTYSNWSTVSFTTLATPPVNDNCASATVLTPGATFATSPLIATNVGATASAETAPGCASYLGGDVWYSVVVPASGNLTFENRTNPSGMTDSAAAVYSGVCGALVLVNCDDSSSLAGDDHPLMTVTGRTPGEILYYRVWEYGNNVFGTVQVSAYDASLSATSFDKSNFVAYPNPVKDVLNLSYKTAISNVRVINLLGQEVLNTKANANDVQVNMSALNSGAYIVNITVDDTVHTIKVIKE